MEYDDAGAVGRRYRRQDEVGTPFCLTYDFDSPEDGAVTVRERDTMTQERIPLEGVERQVRPPLVRLPRHALSSSQAIFKHRKRQ